MSFTDRDFGSITLGGRAIAILATGLLMWFVIAPAIERCSEMPGSPALQQGQRVIYQMAGRENLRQVGFFEAHPGASPSEFVDMIADHSHILWPGTGAGVDEFERRSSNRLNEPPGVVFSARERTQLDSDEIVYAPNDAEMKLIVRGYSPGVAEPTFEYQWEFPTNAGKVPLN